MLRKHFQHLFKKDETLSLWLQIIRFDLIMKKPSRGPLAYRLNPELYRTVGARKLFEEFTQHKIIKQTIYVLSYTDSHK